MTIDTAYSFEGNLAGRTYFERRKPVTVLRSWGPGGGPRNVLIEQEDGTLVVRPFRGLVTPETHRKRMSRGGAS